MNAVDCRERLRHLATRLHLRREETPAMRRMREALDLHDLGVAMYRQRMRRENPQAAENEVEAMVRAWLLEPPRASFLRPPRKDDNDRR